MKNVKKFFSPPLWLLLILTAVSAAGLSLVFLKDVTETPVAYGLYVVSFYTLCAVTCFAIVVLPCRYRAFRQRLLSHPLGLRYMEEAAFRTHVKLYASLSANLLYVVINALSFFLYRSMWFVVLAVYYVILAVMRVLLVEYVRNHGIGKDRPGELRRCRLCACILLLINFALSGAVLMILYQNKGFSYHGILIYVMATYTFYITIHAIVDLIKYRKYKSPVMSASKVVSLSAALVSMLNLETAMFSQFGRTMAPEHQWLMIALTGAGVSLAVITMSLYMILRTAKEIKEITNHGRE